MQCAAGTGTPMDKNLREDIKFNCDVSDARYWGYFSVCGLLMRYRDLFRSERGLNPWSEINRTDITSWIARKESRWPELERLEFRDLAIGDKRYDPFAAAEINRALAGRGLVYGAGYAMYMKPTFFLAELRSVREVAGLTVYTAGREIVRDLFSSPGMQQERTVFIRMEPLVMLLLYKHGELNARKASLLEDAFSRYGFPMRQIIDSTFHLRMEEMAGRYAEILLAHEVAEAAEEVPEWKDILVQVAGDRRLEHYLRAVKDLLADTSEQGPYSRIIQDRDQGALGLTIALTDGYRRTLYPEMRKAYEDLVLRHDWEAIGRARRSGYERFRSRRDEIVNQYRMGGAGDDFVNRLRELMRTADEGA